jgi:hypothetical protein
MSFTTKCFHHEEIKESVSMTPSELLYPESDVFSEPDIPNPPDDPPDDPPSTSKPEISKTNTISNQMTIKDLLSRKFPEPNWLVPNMIVAGIVNLSGRPKAGKSFFALQLAGAKATGGYFLEKQLTMGKVLYIDLENSPARMQRRARTMGISANANLFFSFDKLILDKSGLEKLEKDVEINAWSCVIIDTFSRALKVGADQMKPGEMSDLVGKLQEIALSHNMTIILIDHHRKISRDKNDETDNPVEDILGTTGKTAPLDTAIGLYSNAKEKKLMITGRDIEELVIFLNWNKESYCWSISRDKSEPNESRKDRVFKTIQSMMHQNILPTTTKIACHLNLNKSNVNSDLRDLEREGKIIKGEKRGRELPYILAKQQMPLKNTDEKEECETTTE